MKIHRHLPALFLLSTAFLAACSTASVNPAGTSLTGTSWQLVAIQSMDDAQGTTRIADPASFMLHFGTDGRASLRLDCNRGRGNYEATPATAGSGSLRFGPVATTRALCPPPHLDERVARDLGHVRSYLFKDGRLFLSLMADGGIYEWHPIPITEQTQ